MSSDRLSAILDHQPSTADRARVHLFNDRYGELAYDELLRLFEHPCVTYADIAERFGVTRERVRQWHLSIAPDSPRGHERRRLCQAYQLRRRLLDDSLYRAFVRAAREQYPNLRVQPVPTKSGFRKRLVRLGPVTVALKRGGRARNRLHDGPRTYPFARSSGGADFLFVQFDDDLYLFLPTTMVPRGGTTYLDQPGSKYYAFRNRLAVRNEGPREQVAQSSAPDAAVVDATSLG